MGAIGGLLGTAGGASGTGFSAPTTANLQQGVTTDQTGAAQAGVQNSLQSQNALLSALQAQGGLGAQSVQAGVGQDLYKALAANQAPQAQSQALGQGQALAGQGAGLYGQLANQAGVANQSGAMHQQGALNQGLANVGGAQNLAGAYGQGQAIAGQLAGANAVGTQMGTIGALQGIGAQQQGLAGQYQDIAAGRGPNPAQAMLNQATGANVANQAALMAGQRGAGANVGLMARQAAQQGAATQQQAVGQGATMQANQSLAALGQVGAQQQAMAGTQGQIAGIAGQQLGAQQAQQAALAGQAAQQVGLQQQGISQQGALAGQQVAQQQQQQQIQQAQQQALAGQAAQMTTQQMQQQGQIANQAGVIAGQQIGQVNANTAAQQGNLGTLLGAQAQYNNALTSGQNSANTANAGLASTSMQGQQGLVGGLMNGAGGVLGIAGNAKAEGGMIERRRMADGGAMTPYPAPNGQGPLMPSAPPTGPQSEFGQFLAQSAPDPSLSPAAPQSGPQDNPNSFGSKPLFNAASKLGSSLAMAAMAAKGGLAQGGGSVSAKTQNQKAVKAGNSYDNDKIPAMLSEGEVVIPRSVMQSGDPVRNAADFVAKVMAKRGRAS